MLLNVSFGENNDYREPEQKPARINARAHAREVKLLWLHCAHVK